MTTKIVKNFAIDLFLLVGFVLMLPILLIGFILKQLLKNREEIVIVTLIYCLPIIFFISLSPMGFLWLRSLVGL